LSRPRFGEQRHLERVVRNLFEVWNATDL
jgi:hypothetical protein